MIEKNKKIKGNESFNYVTMALFDLNDPGLAILPTYRLVKGLEKLEENNFVKNFIHDFEIYIFTLLGLE